MKYGLTDEEFEELLRLAVRPLKSMGAMVWIFGSRSSGDYKQFSDIDVLFRRTKDYPLPSGFIYEIRTNLEESRLPYKVDLVDDADLAASYRSKVNEDMIPL